MWRSRSRDVFLAGARVALKGRLWLYQVYFFFLSFFASVPGFSTLLHIIIIVGDAGFKPGTSVPEVWCATNEPSHLHFFFLTTNLGVVLLIYLYSIHIAICRPSDHSVVTGEAPGRDSNPGRAELMAGTLSTRPPVYLYRYSLMRKTSLQKYYSY